MSNIQNIFNEMLEFCEGIADREPQLAPLINNFIQTRRVNVFLSVLRTREEIEPVLFALPSQQEEKAKKILFDMMLSNNIDKDLLTAEELSKFVQYIILWVEIICEDIGSDDDE